MLHKIEHVLVFHTKNITFILSRLLRFFVIIFIPKNQNYIDNYSVSIPNIKFLRKFVHFILTHGREETAYLRVLGANHKI
ncbi:unnamed protein product [Leptidea sinapis]|uniref:Uncharacterized protein n=1 Tax=Leptidea sinapis TaxID=189913 RepID=A0A5E4PWY1_9NEOP|nr:unnamed protein product [Leptidea sinapis]